MLTWTALEVLSPQSFRRPEELASGEGYRIARFQDHALPWEKGGEKSRRNYRLYYQIILGTIDMEPAISQLLSVYTDKRAERPQTKGECILATLLVDREGRPVESDAVTVSSFAWGVPIALKGDLKALGEWQPAERELLEALDERIRRYDDDGHPTSLTLNDIDAAYDWLVAQLDLPTEIVQRPYFAVRSYQWFRIDEPPEALLLNSFFLTDLHRARELFREGEATPNLSRYVGQIVPDERHDLLRDQAAITSALHPAKMPHGRWPAAGRYPLVALQQVAVNLAAHDLEGEGILAVNGPPGTGKTTLLRDIVAHVVTERARVMVRFDDPETVFHNSKQRVRRGNAFLWMYELDERLRGFEMVVASSNNKAVENVSAELPGIEAVASDALTAGYFKTVSDALLGRETWGMIAAVLGNAANRAKFRQSFWWDEECGFTRYLQHACGTPVFVTEESESGEKIERPPLIITAEKPPGDKHEALLRWKAARRKFRAAAKTAERVLKLAERAAELPPMIVERDEMLARLEAKMTQTAANLERLHDEHKSSEREEQQADQAHKKAQRNLALVRGAKPSFLSRLFARRRFTQWKQEFLEASSHASANERVLKESKARRNELISSLQSEQTKLDEGEPAGSRAA